MKWFAVKTIYRSDTAQRPVKPDLNYDPDATSMEERTLLIKACTRREALSKAEKEARSYADKMSCVNPYQQRVTTRYTGFYDVFELPVAPGDKSEVFSVSRIISRRINDRKLARIYAGRHSRDDGRGKWKKFINHQYEPRREV